MQNDIDMSPKLLGYCWFGGKTCVGIVLIETKYTNEVKAYIATVAGIDEKRDIDYIIDWGTHFPVEEAKSIIEKYGTKLT